MPLTTLAVTAALAAGAGAAARHYWPARRAETTAAPTAAVAEEPAPVLPANPAEPEPIVVPEPVAEPEPALEPEPEPEPELEPQVLVPDPPPAWEAPPPHPPSPACERYIDRTSGKLYECYALGGHAHVSSAVAGESTGEAGDWLCHSGSTGARFIVPAAEFAERFVRLTEGA